MTGNSSERLPKRLSVGAIGKRRLDQRGFSLLAVVVSASVMLASMGLAVDVGRMFIVKNELQRFADASAMAACRQLDGTQTGLTEAHKVALVGPLGDSLPNGWNFDSATVSTVTDNYGTTFSGGYDSYATGLGSTTNSYRFISVKAQATLPLYFLRVIPGLPTVQAIDAVATAGQQASNAVGNGGLAPFMPDAHDPTDTRNFGFTPNVPYTMKWGNGSRNTSCAGDVGFNNPNPSSQHGFVDLGQGNGNSALRDVIVYGGYPNASSTPSTVYEGLFLGGVPGNRGSSIFGALQERSNQDPDQMSMTWEAYKSANTGNNRRVITMAIGDPSTWTGNGNGTAKVIGFGNFLLYPGATYTGSSGAVCAIYIGPGSLNNLSSGGTDGTKIYTTMMYR